MLAGLLKRIVPGAKAVTLGTADEVERFLAVTAHASISSGKTAFVTGSTRGIGLAIAQTLYGAGAKVAVVGRDVERARRGGGEPR